jgi:hypothetical protein
VPRGARRLALAIALLAWLPPGGCSHATEERPSPPAAAEPSAPPETPAPPSEAAPPEPTRDAEDRGEPPPAPEPPEAGAPGPSQEPPAATTVDLHQLQERLRDTDAIGFFTKLKLKNELDDLVDAMRAHFAGADNPSLEQLRERYDLLLMKVLAVLDEGDPALSRDLSASRDRLWDLLADPQRYVQS